MVKDNVIFQNAITAPANGLEYVLDNLEDNTEITVSITGTATARTVVFEAQGLVGGYVPINGFNENSAVLATQSTGTTDELWTLSIGGMSKFRCKVTAVSGGNLTVAGKVIQ